MSRYINADLTDTEILNAVQEETANGDTFITVRRILNKLPTADVVPVIHAKWIEKNYLIKSYFECSNCLFTTLKDTRYCPHCGAIMDAEEEEE